MYAENRCKNPEVIPAAAETSSAAAQTATAAAQTAAPMAAAAAQTATAAAAQTAAPENVSYTAELSGIGSALENALGTDRMNQTPQAQAAVPPAPEAAPEVKPEEIELAIPQRTLDELLQEAYANGEDPKVVKNPTTGITFVDYSNCL